MNLTVTMSPKEHERIFSKIQIDPTTKCWVWKGSIDLQGYGLLWYKGKTERIHRVLYAFFVQPVPRGVENRRLAQIDHLCRNTSCCNPDHLELVSQRVNGIRGEGLQAKNAQKTHCKYGHPLPPYDINHTQKRARAFCKTCDSIRHKERMQGPNREYWLRKANEATKRYYDKSKYA